MAGNGGEFGAALRAFFERGLKSVFFPGFFMGRRLARGSCRRCRRDRRLNLRFFSHAVAAPAGFAQTGRGYGADFNAMRKTEAGQGNEGGKAPAGNYCRFGNGAHAS